MNRDDLPKPNRTCKVCGRPYYACSRCIELMGKGIYTWKLDADTHECYRIYLTVKDFQAGRIDKQTAKSQLLQEPIDELRSLVPSIASVTRAILASEPTFSATAHSRSNRKKGRSQETHIANQ